MNATELQTRLQNFAYRIVVLCESLPYGRMSSITHDHLMQVGKTGSVNYRCYKTTRKGHGHKAFSHDLTTALKENSEAQFQLGYMIDLHLVHPAKLFSLQKAADELTNIFNSREIAIKRNESPGTIKY